MRTTRGCLAHGCTTRPIGDGESGSEIRGGGLLLGVPSQQERANFGPPPHIASPTREHIHLITATSVPLAISRIPVARALMVA